MSYVSVCFGLAVLQTLGANIFMLSLVTNGSHQNAWAPNERPKAFRRTIYDFDGSDISVRIFTTNAKHVDRSPHPRTPFCFCGVRESDRLIEAGVAFGEQEYIVQALQIAFRSNVLSGGREGRGEGRGD